MHLSWKSDAEADTNEPLDDQQASASAADNAKDDGGIVDAADAKDNIKSWTNISQSQFTEE